MDKEVGWMPLKGRYSFASQLEKQGIKTTEQLANYLPTAYHDYRNVANIKYVTRSNHVAVKGILQKVDLWSGTVNGRETEVLKLSFKQEDGTWFNVSLFAQGYMWGFYYSRRLMPFIILGVVEHSEYGYSIKNIEDIVLENDFIGGIYPVYKKIKRVSNTLLIPAIKDAVSESKEILEPEIVSKCGLMDYKAALLGVHSPKDETEFMAASQRILFNDLLYFAIALKMSDNGGKNTSPFLFGKREVTDNFINSLSFDLTEDQINVINKVITSASNGRRNNILLQGDVGCGKTIVAVSLMICAAENGFQSVLMAPRTVLAEQHFKEISKYAEMLGISCCFLRSGMKASEKKAMINKIKDGSVTMIVGTHSVLSEGVDYKSLGLIITDEEHLFGVKQKEMLVKKANDGVHSVSMSATPIPRSLALVLFGEQKEICSIKTMPKGRLPIKTGVMKDKRDFFPFILNQINSGHQCYVVCPAIEESDNLTSIEEVEHSYRDYFERKNRLSVVIVNGKMKEEKISENIEKFSRNEAQILISTTVIEVGVNVPNATVMVVEQAERFGLASLHQLRGRVGRSSFQSYCILHSDDMTNERLQTMVSTTNGYEIAEADLKQRGSGNLIGTEQAGMNRFVQKMLENRLFFEQIRPLADFCIEKGYGKKLIDLYS